MPVYLQEFIAKGPFRLQKPADLQECGSVYVTYSVQVALMTFGSIYVAYSVHVALMTFGSIYVTYSVHVSLMTLGSVYVAYSVHVALMTLGSVYVAYSVHVALMTLGSVYVTYSLHVALMTLIADIYLPPRNCKRLKFRMFILLLHLAKYCERAPCRSCSIKTCAASEAAQVSDRDRPLREPSASY
jgi:hypothetical protein